MVESCTRGTLPLMSWRSREGPEALRPLRHRLAHLGPPGQVRDMSDHPCPAPGVLPGRTPRQRRDHRPGVGHQLGWRGRPTGGDGRRGGAQHRSGLAAALSPALPGAGRRLLGAGGGAGLARLGVLARGGPGCLRGAGSGVGGRSVRRRGERGGPVALRLGGERREPAGHQHELTLGRRRRTAFHPSCARSRSRAGSGCR